MTSRNGGADGGRTHGRRLQASARLIGGLDFAGVLARIAAAGKRWIRRLLAREMKEHRPAAAALEPRNRRSVAFVALGWRKPSGAKGEERRTLAAGSSRQSAVPQLQTPRSMARGWAIPQIGAERIDTRYGR